MSIGELQNLVWLVREKGNDEVAAPLMLVTSPTVLLAGHGVATAPVWSGGDDGDVGCVVAAGSVEMRFCAEKKCSWCLKKRALKMLMRELWA